MLGGYATIAVSSVSFVRTLIPNLPRSDAAGLIRLVSSGVTAEYIAGCMRGWKRGLVRAKSGD